MAAQQLQHFLNTSLFPPEGATSSITSLASHNQGQPSPPPPSLKLPYLSTQFAIPLKQLQDIILTFYNAHHTQLGLQWALTGRTAAGSLKVAVVPQTGPEWIQDDEKLPFEAVDERRLYGIYRKSPEDGMGEESQTTRRPEKNVEDMEQWGCNLGNLQHPVYHPSFPVNGPIVEPLDGDSLPIKRSFTKAPVIKPKSDPGTGKRLLSGPLPMKKTISVMDSFRNKASERKPDVKKGEGEKKQDSVQDEEHVKDRVNGNEENNIRDGLQTQTITAVVSSDPRAANKSEMNAPKVTRKVVSRASNSSGSRRQVVDEEQNSRPEPDIDEDDEDVDMPSSLSRKRKPRSNAKARKPRKKARLSSDDDDGDEVDSKKDHQKNHPTKRADREKEERSGTETGDPDETKSNGTKEAKRSRKRPREENPTPTWAKADEDSGIVRKRRRKVKKTRRYVDDWGRNVTEQVSEWETCSDVDVDHTVQMKMSSLVKRCAKAESPGSPAVSCESEKAGTLGAALNAAEPCATALDNSLSSSSNRSFARSASGKQKSLMSFFKRK